MLHYLHIYRVRSGILFLPETAEEGKRQDTKNEAAKTIEAQPIIVTGVLAIQGEKGKEGNTKRLT